MSGTESNPTADAPEEAPEDARPKSAEASAAKPFSEGDHETLMTYGHGGFPRYVMAAWVCFLIGYAIYFYTYGWPDLTAWGRP